MSGPARGRTAAGGRGPRQGRATAAHAQPLLRGAAASRGGAHRRVAVGGREAARARALVAVRHRRRVADAPVVSSRPMLRVVVHTPDVVGERMAGPGIRAWHLADELSKHFDVALVARLEGKPPARVPFPLLARGTPQAKRALHDADVLVAQPARGAGTGRAP